MAAESLKEYLVKLGWDLDENGFRKAIDQFSDFEGKADGFVGKLTKRLATAGGIVFSIISSTAVATGKLLDSVSDADRATERFARRMWTTKENARSFITALDAMDAEYEDIFYMTPEEYQRFISLKNFGQRLEAPQELNETLKLVRDIQYEFSRLKVIASYGTQWIAYYVGRYMGIDLEEIGTKFRNFNDWLMQHIPQMAEKIARILTTIVRLGKAGVRFIGDLIGALSKLWNSMSDGEKATIGFGAAFMGLLKTGPIGLFIGALFLILTLLEDFYNWKDGKPSAFTGMWEDLSDWKKGLEETGELDEWITRIDHLVGSFGNLLVSIGKFGKSVYKWADDVGILKFAYEGFKAVLDIIAGLIDDISSGLQTISDLISAASGHPDDISEGSPVVTQKKYNPSTGEYETSLDWWATLKNFGSGIVDWFNAGTINEYTGEKYPSSGGYSGITNGENQTYIDQSTTSVDMTVNGYEKETAESATHRAATEVIKNIKKNNPIR